MDNTQLSQIICTRISHDLIGNVGALSNALELLEDGDTDFFDDIKKILSVSSKVLSARMRFFRMAFGLENAALNDNTTVFAAIKDYLNTLGNMSYAYNFAAENTLPQHNRAILISSMILADLLVKGGEIKTCFENNSLWMAATSEFALSEVKMKAIKDILSGSDAYDNDAQYAHIICLREFYGRQGQVKLVDCREKNIVLQIPSA